MAVICKVKFIHRCIRCPWLWGRVWKQVELWEVARYLGPPQRCHIRVLPYCPVCNQCTLFFFTDNEALVHVINKHSCKDQSLMYFVRKLVLICLKYNIVFKAKHIPGVKNNLADALSRLQDQSFPHFAPAHMDKLLSKIPLHLQPEN